MCSFVSQMSKSSKQAGNGKKNKQAEDCLKGLVLVYIKHVNLGVNLK